MTTTEKVLLGLGGTAVVSTVIYLVTKKPSTTVVATRTVASNPSLGLANTTLGTGNGNVGNTPTNTNTITPPPVVDIHLSDPVLAVKNMLSALNGWFPSNPSVISQMPYLQQSYNTALANNDLNTITNLIQPVSQLLVSAIKTYYDPNYLSHGWKDAQGNYIDRDLDKLYSNIVNNTSGYNYQALANGIIEVGNPAYYGGAVNVPGSKRFNVTYKVTDYIHA